MGCRMTPTDKFTFPLASQRRAPGMLHAMAGEIMLAIWLILAVIIRLFEE